MNCPKCGRPMAMGAPHGPWPVQYECRPCNVYVAKGASR
jgi:ribosomal protein L37AE/L43A